MGSRGYPSASSGSLYLYPRHVSSSSGPRQRHSPRCCVLGTSIWNCWFQNTIPPPAPASPSTTSRQRHSPRLTSHLSPPLLSLPDRSSLSPRRRASSHSDSDDDSPPPRAKTLRKAPPRPATDNKFFVGVAGRSRKGCLLSESGREELRPPTPSAPDWILGSYSVTGRVCVCASER